MIHRTTFKKSDLDDLTDRLNSCLNGENRFECKMISNYILDKYNLIPKIIIHSDNISAFRILCNNYDSIAPNKWKYMTINSRYPDGATVIFKTGTKEY